MGGGSHAESSSGARARLPRSLRAEQRHHPRSREPRGSPPRRHPAGTNGRHVIGSTRVATGRNSGPAADDHRTEVAASERSPWRSDEVGARTPAQTLQSVKINRSVIEDFRPLHVALEWRIAQAYWVRR